MVQYTIRKKQLNIIFGVNYDKYAGANFFFFTHISNWAKYNNTPAKEKQGSKQIPVELSRPVIEVVKGSVYSICLFVSIYGANKFLWRYTVLFFSARMVHSTMISLSWTTEQIFWRQPVHAVKCCH
jgi:hypothetical protein